MSRTRQPDDGEPWDRRRPSDEGERTTSEGPRVVAPSGPLFEVVPREDTRTPVGSRPRPPWRSVAYLLPAGVVTGVCLVFPLVTAMIVSLGNGPQSYSDALHAAGSAIGHSIGWLLFVPVVCLAGLGIAGIGRGARRGRNLVIGVLAAPVAVSALVTGIAFRMIFDPDPARGTVAATVGGGVMLGHGWIWVVLTMAFAWQWTGLAVIVFRAGLAGIPRDLLRMARSLGTGRARRIWTIKVPALFPVGALITMIVLVAAVRVFDLVIVAVPGSMQHDVDVVALYWWRSGGDLGDAGSAALAVMPFLVVAGAALAILWGLRREWPTARTAEPPPRRERPRFVRWTVRVVGVLGIALWILPLVVLLLTSLHTPRAAAGAGWWSGGFGLDSYRRAFHSGELLHSLLSTGARSSLAALLVLALALPAAYALAWGRLSRRVTTTLVAITAVLAVVPPQTVIVALGGIFDTLHLLGSPTALTLVHTAFGVPLGVLLLRAAFASVPREPVRVRQAQDPSGTALSIVVRKSLPAVVTVVVLEFVIVWNDLIVGLLLGGPNSGQVTLVLLEQSRYFSISSGVLAASAVVTTVVPLALVLLTGRWLVRGLTEGVQR